MAKVLWDLCQQSAQQKQPLKQDQKDFLAVQKKHLLKIQTINLWILPSMPYQHQSIHMFDFYQNNFKVLF